MARSTLLLTWLSLLTACGAKTGLEVERCADAGLRRCENVCGPGTQACGIDGRWQACMPDAVERDCDNACGRGIEFCTPEGWTACEVEPVEQACEDECGAGIEQCLDGAWSGCITPPLERPCVSVCGDGIEQCELGEWGPCRAAGPSAPVLSVVVRDMLDTHPDFEDAQGTDRGIVEEELGADGLPVYAGLSRTTHGPEAFDQWFRDVPGVNASATLELPLEAAEPGGERFVFDDDTFFPIDGQLLGNQGRAHNFHFTLEIATEFEYAGGETFRFRGDDDVWVFIDGRRVIDLGGVHRAQEQTVSVDELELEVGERYALRMFFAERHTTESSFRIETTLQDPLRCE